MTLMNRLFAVFTCALLLSNVARAQRAEWILLLKTGGAPWEKKFEVSLDHTGALSVIENDAGQIPASTSKLALSLSPSDTQAVMNKY